MSMKEKNSFALTKLIFRIMHVTVVQWSKSCSHVQMNWVRIPATLTLFFFFLFSLCF